MAQQVFAYIIHKEGHIDDTALELITAAKKIDPEASVCAVAVGSGPELESACSTAASTYKEVWKVDDGVFAYANAEVVRSALVRILPQGSIVLIPHEHFGMDLAPGLSIKMGVRAKH